MPATPDQRQAFGEALRAERTKRGLTMQQVVDALRPQDETLSTARYSAWEKGQYAPSSTSKIDMLEAYFDTPAGRFHALLGGPAPTPSQVEILEARVAAIEEHLGIGQAESAKSARHLRAADAKTVADPGPRRRGKPRPTGAASEFE